MIFAPFTGKDNHGSPVTFAAGLLSKENAESFSWLFDRFVKCMGVAPKLIITDQDRGMKVAVKDVLVNTRHRWCMWHIMNKVAENLPKNKLGIEDLKKELNASVWSELIEPDAFEEGWNHIMEKYELVENDWFSKMYKNREYWIPAFFRDFPMSSLMKTTSISESENSFFKRYSKCRANLVQFLMNYNHALDVQRSNYAKREFNDSSKSPVGKTHLAIEKHASTVYSGGGYVAIESEIEDACFTCGMVEMCTNSDNEMYKVNDKLSGIWKVIYSVGDDTYACECKMFERLGLVCCHIFFVLKNKHVKTIPEKLLGGRWLKSKLLTPVHGVCVDDGEMDFVLDDSKADFKNLVSLFYEIAQSIEGNSEKIKQFAGFMLEGQKQVLGEGNVLSSVQKKQMIETFYGSKVPSNIEVHPPDVVKTKGSGSRLISRQEKAIRMSMKPGRRCAKCHEVGNHDSRNCDKVKDKMKQKA